MSKLEQIRDLINEAERIADEIGETGDHGIIQRTVRAAAARIRLKVSDIARAQPEALFEQK